MSKASKHLRDCPAAGRQITSRECGEGRQTHFSCPVECPHNPFSPANYDQFGEIEGRFIDKTLEYFRRENRGNPALMESFRKAQERGVGDATAFCFWECFWRRDGEGLTMADRWEKRRFDGLDNDERVVLAGHRSARPALVEIRRVVDDTLVECVDLLSGERFSLADRSLARTAVRFDALLAWLTPQPHFARFLGHAVVPPDVAPLTPREVLLGTARHLGAPEEPDAMLRWLAEHWRGVARAFGEIGKALRHEMLMHLDARHHRTDYRLLKGAHLLRQKLAKHRDIQPEQLSQEERDAGFDEGFVWLEPELSADPRQPELPSLIPATRNMPGRRVLGRVLLGAETVRLEASATARNAQLRPNFERLAAGLVEFHAEKVDDIAAQTAGPANYDATVVPPEFLAHAPRIELATSHLEQSELPAGDKKEMEAELGRRHRDLWLGQRIPLLDGHTPREAAAIPALRGKLIGLVKRLVALADRESPEASVGASQLIDTLGLDEIAEPTPPARPGLYKGDMDAGEAAEEPYFPEGDDPPRQPLSEDEIEARVRNFIASYPINEIEKLDDDFEELADDLIEAFDHLTPEILNEHEQDHVYTTLMRLYFVLVPGATERMPIDNARLVARLMKWSAIFAAAHEEAIDRFEALFEPFEGCRQPRAALDAVNVLLNMEGKKRKEQLRMEAVPIVLALLAAAADELDCTVMEAALGL